MVPMLTCGLFRLNDSLAMVVDVSRWAPARPVMRPLELVGGIEPPTSSLPRMRSTPELHEPYGVDAGPENYRGVRGSLVSWDKDPREFPGRFREKRGGS